MKKIQTSFGMFPADIGVGPSRFARFENELPPQDVQLIDKATAVKADSPAWRLRTDYRSELLPNEDEEDPEKKACPTGGCPPDTKLNKDIYWYMMEQTAKEKKLDLKDEHQRSKAHTIILPLFRQRVRENRKYERQDKEGPPDAYGPDFEVTHEGIYYPAFGKTLRQMRADFKRLRPEQFDPVADATLELMDLAFANGATRVRHISHNKDAQGKDAIRDEITMIVDDKTGKGKMEIRNIAKDGKYLSNQEAYDVMKKSHIELVEGHPEEGVFIFTDVPMESKQVHKVLADSYEYQSETTDAPQYTMTEFSEWIDTPITEIHDIQTPFRVPVFLQKLLGKEIERHEMSQNYPTVQEILKSPALQIFTTEPAIDTEKGEDLVVVWKQTAQEVLEISEDEADHLVGEIVSLSQEMSEKQEILSFIEETGVGMGAAIAIIDEMARLQVANPTEREPLEKVETVSENIQEEDVVMTWLASFIGRVKDKQPEEIIAEIQKEEEKTLENIAIIWEIFQQETIEQFQFAVVFWFLFKLSSYVEGLEALKEKQSVPEALIHPEETQWILLAIIWALAMKREGGVVQTTQTTSVQQSATPRLQRTAVIFAYPS